LAHNPQVADCFVAGLKPQDAAVVAFAEAGPMACDLDWSSLADFLDNLGGCLLVQKSGHDLLEIDCCCRIVVGILDYYRLGHTLLAAVLVLVGVDEPRAERQRPWH
jgi:hypothetical protein